MKMNKILQKPWAIAKITGAEEWVKKQTVKEVRPEWSNGTGVVGGGHFFMVFNVPGIPKVWEVMRNKETLFFIIRDISKKT